MVSILTRYSRCSRFESRPTHLLPSHVSSPFPIAFKNRQICRYAWAPRYQSVYGRSRKPPAFIRVTNLSSGASPGIQRKGSLSYSKLTKCWSRHKFLEPTMDWTTTSNILAVILFIRVVRLTERAMAASTQNYYFMRYRRVNHRPLKALRFDSVQFNTISKWFHKQNYTCGTIYFYTSICGCDSFKSAN